MAVKARERTWHVHDDADARFHGTYLQEIGEEPGALTSWAPPPPGGKPVRHPFLSAHTNVTNYESRLRRLLDQATDLMDYLARIQRDGLRVQMVSPPQHWHVRRGGGVVATVSDLPAFLDPGPADPLTATRQFLSLAAVAAAEREPLRQLLEGSESLSGFLGNLVDAGYSVESLD